MHKLDVDSLTVTSFEVAPDIDEMTMTTGGAEPTYPRCSRGATGCEYCPVDTR